MFCTNRIKEIDNVMCSLVHVFIYLLQSDSIDVCIINILRAS